MVKNFVREDIHCEKGVFKGRIILYVVPINSKIGGYFCRRSVWAGSMVLGKMVYGDSCKVVNDSCVERWGIILMHI